MVPACEELSLDEGHAFVGRPLAVVVLDDMIEEAGLLFLLPCEQDPRADLARALGRALEQPALEFVEGRVDEDRHRARHAVLYGQRAVQLELEQRHAPFRGNPVELREERPRPLAPRETRSISRKSSSLRRRSNSSSERNQ